MAETKVSEKEFEKVVNSVIGLKPDLAEILKKCFPQGEVRCQLKK